LGHCHEHLVNEIQAQSKKLWHVSNAFIIPEQERLAKRLTDNTFADFVCFQNSGTEATEASIKIARKYFHKIGKPEKNRIITFQGAFHGRTLAALFAANNPKHTEGFGPKVEGFDQVPFADHEAIKKTINKNTAAIMIETIMGEGGIKVVPDVCIKGLREICDEHGILLILDEVQCAYRTGNFFAFENSGINPDIVPIAKGIGGGFPLGACLVTKKVAVGMTAGTHGSTFGGNPLAMTVGNAVLDVIFKKGFLDNVKEKGKYFDQGLNKIKNNKINIIFGTHALFQKKIIFNNLGYIIIDEQHKFGVRQRKLLSDKGGRNCDILLMSATPIPRTLTMTLYGDMDLSIIREKPKLRKEIKTYSKLESKIEDVIKFVKKELKNNNQYSGCAL